MRHIWPLLSRPPSTRKSWPVVAAMEPGNGTMPGDFCGSSKVCGRQELPSAERSSSKAAPPFHCGVPGPREISLSASLALAIASVSAAHHASVAA